MTEIIEALKSLPKDFLEVIIFTLMVEGKIEYHRLTEMHIEHLEQLKRGQSVHYMQLVSKVLHMHTEGKKNLVKNMGKLLHYLRDNGEANLLPEEIDRIYTKQKKGK